MNLPVSALALSASHLRNVVRRAADTCAYVCVYVRPCKRACASACPLPAHECSSYLTKSKTYTLSKEEYEALITQPCHYCGKPTLPGSHYNGLDRIDSTVRVYTPVPFSLTQPRSRAPLSLCSPRTLMQADACLEPVFAVSSCARALRRKSSN